LGHSPLVAPTVSAASSGLSDIGMEERMRAIEATRKDIVMIEASAPIEHAAAVMHSQNVGALVVVEDGVPVGIVTDRDIVVRGVRTRMPLDARVDAVMTPGVVALDADGDVRDAVTVFRAHAFRRLPLVRDGKLVGLLSTDDLLTEISLELSELIHPIMGQVVSMRPEPEQTLARTER
jgi:CBS domain-containing protein